MRRLIKTLILITLLFTITGCKHEMRMFDEPEKFIEELYDFQVDTDSEYVIIDFRPLGENEVVGQDYATSHISGAAHYDYIVDKPNEFINWVNSLYTTKTSFFLIDNGEGLVEEIGKSLGENGFNRVYVFTKGYDTLKSSPAYETYLYEGKGTEDCGC